MPPGLHLLERLNGAGTSGKARIIGRCSLSTNFIGDRRSEQPQMVTSSWSPNLTTSIPASGLTRRLRNHLSGNEGAPGGH